MNNQAPPNYYYPISYQAVPAPNYYNNPSVPPQNVYYPMPNSNHVNYNYPHQNEFNIGIPVTPVYGPGNTGNPILYAPVQVQYIDEYPNNVKMSGGYNYPQQSFKN